MIQHFRTSVKSSNIPTCTDPQGPLHFNSNTYFFIDKFHLNTCQLSPMHTDKTTQLWTAKQGSKWEHFLCFRSSNGRKKVVDLIWILSLVQLRCMPQEESRGNFLCPESHIESQLRKSERLALLQDLRVSWEKQWIWWTCICCEEFCLHVDWKFSWHFEVHAMTQQT